MIQKLRLLLLFVAALPALGVQAQTTRPLYFTGVDEPLYKDNMTIVAQVMQGSTLLTDCELAAFDEDDALRGSAATLSGTNGLIFLSVQGNNTEGTIHFKAVTGSDNTVSPVKGSMTFCLNKMVGSVEDPQIFYIGAEPGDMDGNTLFTIGDLVQLVAVLNGVRTDTYGAADVDGNGTVNVADVQALRNKILEKAN